jgi:hypothetical protein
MQVKGIESSYSAWKSPEFRNIFKSRSDFATLIEITAEFLFVGMAVASPHARPPDG